MQKVVKIHVLDSDGTGTGGLWDQRIGPDDRVWPAPPAADYQESLVLFADGQSWKWFRSEHPKLHSYGDDEWVDEKSYAIRCTAGEAAKWLERHGYEIPADVKRTADKNRGMTLPPQHKRRFRKRAGKHPLSEEQVAARFTFYGAWVKSQSDGNDFKSFCGSYRLTNGSIINFKTANTWRNWCQKYPDRKPKKGSAIAVKRI